jgi:hypothetical protein
MPIWYIWWSFWFIFPIWYVVSRKIWQPWARAAAQPAATDRAANKYNLPTSRLQGCQIFLGTTYQHGEKYTKLPQNVPNGHKKYQMAVKYSKWT